MIGGVESGGAESAALLAKLKAGGGKKAAQAPIPDMPSDEVMDIIDLSPQARAALKRGSAFNPENAEIKLRIENEDVKRTALSAEDMDNFTHEMIGFHRDQREYFDRSEAFMREKFNLPIDPGGGFMLTGDPLMRAVDRRMAENGDRRPEKSAKLQAWEKYMGDEPSPDERSAAVKGVSMIVMALPENQGTGDKQVEMWIDNSAIDKLSKMSAEEVKAGLMNLKAGGEAAAAGNAAVTNGVFGAYMKENAAYHPEFTKSDERYALFDKDKGAAANPMLMIQSVKADDFVTKNIDSLVAGLMGVLKSAGKGSA